MLQIDIFPLYGVTIGINYSNEDLEMMEIVADDKRHTIQLFFFVFGLNIHWYTIR